METHFPTSPTLAYKDCVMLCMNGLAQIPGGAVLQKVIQLCTYLILSANDFTDVVHKAKGL